MCTSASGNALNDSGHVSCTRCGASWPKGSRKSHRGQTPISISNCLPLETICSAGSLSLLAFFQQCVGYLGDSCARHNRWLGERVGEASHPGPAGGGLHRARCLRKAVDTLFAAIVRTDGLVSPRWSGNPHAGVRIGEASHPGPAAPKGLEASGFLGPGLLDAIKGAIQKIVEQAVKQSLGQLSAPSQLSAKAKKKLKAKLKKAALKKGGQGGAGAPADRTPSAHDPGDGKGGQGQR